MNHRFRRIVDAPASRIRGRRPFSFSFLMFQRAKSTQKPRAISVEITWDWNMPVKARTAIHHFFELPRNRWIPADDQKGQEDGGQHLAQGCPGVQIDKAVHGHGIQEGRNEADPPGTAPGGKRRSRIPRPWPDLPLKSSDASSRWVRVPCGTAGQRGTGKTRNTAWEPRSRSPGTSGHGSGWEAGFHPGPSDRLKTRP